MLYGGHAYLQPSMAHAWRLMERVRLASNSSYAMFQVRIKQAIRMYARSRSRRHGMSCSSINALHGYMARRFALEVGELGHPSPEFLGRTEFRCEEGAQDLLCDTDADDPASDT